MLIALSDECAQTTVRKTMPGNNLQPNVSIVPNISRKAQRRIRARIYSKRSAIAGHTLRHSNTSPLVTLNIRGQRGLCRPHQPSRRRLIPK